MPPAFPAIPAVPEATDPPSPSADGRDGGIGTRAAAAVVVVALLLATLFVTDVARPERSGASTCASSSAIAMAERAAEERFHTKLNGMRRSLGLRTVVLNSAMSYESLQWSKEMARRRTLEHDSTLLGGLLNIVSSLVRVAENVGRATVSLGCTSTEVLSAMTRTVDLLHGAFAESPGHYRNMVGAYNQAGIGVHIDGRELWVTVRFADGALPSSTAESTRRYVDALHQLFLSRKATQVEVDRWAATVRSGQRDAITRALAVSDEWAGVRIADLYASVLGRAPDAAGRRYWVSRVSSGILLETVAAGFYASDEYFGRKGGTDRRFVAGLYQDILGRRADAAGLDYWALMMSRGMSRYQVAASFYASVESRNDRVRTLYREILGRRPDPSGLAYWANQLRSVGDIGLASYLASSQEYYQRSTR